MIKLMAPSQRQANESSAVSRYRVGLISDTHGLIRPEALRALGRSDLIIHCGDVGDPTVLEALRTIAPVRAVRGNNDKGEWARDLAATDLVGIGGHLIYVLHNLSDLQIDPQTAGVAAVIYGHSHRPAIERRGEVLFVNPGSAGPRRFSLPVAVAMLTLRPGACEATIVRLEASKPVGKRGADRR